jgi:hypothetical protein
MKLTHIQSKERWEEFEKALFDRFYINCTVYDVSGQGITGKPNWCNRLGPVEKAMGLNETQILELCEGLGTMTQVEAEKMAAYIEKRTAQFVDDYLKKDL